MTHPYYPLTTNTYSDFLVNDIEGGYAGDGNFWISYRKLHSIPEVRVTILPVGNLAARVHHRGALPAIISPGNTLYEGRHGSMVGEYGGTGVASLGPIALLDDNDFPGRVMDQTLPVMRFVNNEPSWIDEYRARRYVLHMGQPWSVWPDTIRVTLVENFDTVHPDVLISYVFARGIGLVNMWRGVLMPNGLVEGGIETYYVGGGVIS